LPPHWYGVSDAQHTWSGHTSGALGSGQGLKLSALLHPFAKTVITPATNATLSTQRFFFIDDPFERAALSRKNGSRGQARKGTRPEGEVGNPRMWSCEEATITWSHKRPTRRRRYGAGFTDRSSKSVTESAFVHTPT
jgi:hypothetical protein